MKNTEQHPQPAKPHIEELVELLGEKIIERGYNTPNGVQTDRPSRGELTDVRITKTNTENWARLLIEEGFNGTYNGGYVHDDAFCYYKDLNIESKWGKGLQFFPRDGFVRVC